VKALVTGSAGFVGRHLCPKLEAAGYDVSRCDIEYGFPFQEWRARGMKPVEPLDVLIHLAANIVNVDARMNGGMDMYSDIELDLAMCRWLENNPPKQCAVLMSSCAVDYPQDPYCIVKRNLESFAQTLHKKGVPVVVLRPFSGYGEDQSEEYPFRAILERVKRREDPLSVWGGNQIRDWVHVDDLTDAIMFAIKELPRRAEPVEVGTRRGTSLKDLALTMAQAAGYDPKISCDESKPSSSARRVAGENGNAILQAWGWTPKISLEGAISRALEGVPCRQ
jgi:nucleoside-diphosphate-sugar epimerase